MRRAVVADIHGNLSALEAVASDIARRGVDMVVHAGDLALIGARPADVLDRISDLCWRGIVGNTDELLWRPDQLTHQLQQAPKLKPLLRLLFETYAPATIERLGEQRIANLQSLPMQLRLDGVVLVHATPGNLWRAPMPTATEEELEDSYRALGAPLVIYGHIHRPFVSRLDGLTVANAGSVGLPWNGDPRASYLLVDDDRAEIVRVDYDIEGEIAALRASGYPDHRRISEMLRRGRFVPVPER